MSLILLARRPGT